MCTCVSAFQGISVNCVVLVLHMALMSVTDTIMAFWGLWQFEWQCCVIVFVHWRRYWYQLNITPKHAATCPVMWITLADKIRRASPHCTDCHLLELPQCKSSVLTDVCVCACVCVYATMHRFAYILYVGVCISMRMCVGGHFVPWKEIII